MRRLSNSLSVKSVSVKCSGKRRVRRMAPKRRGGTARLNNKNGRLLLSNIGAKVDCDQMEDVFRQYGPVGRVVIHLNENEKRMGTAEVWMSSGLDADKAMKKLNATDIFNDDHIIRVDKPSVVDKLCDYWKKVFKNCVNCVEKIYNENFGNNDNEKCVK